MWVFWLLKFCGFRKIVGVIVINYFNLFSYCEMVGGFYFCKKVVVVKVEGIFRDLFNRKVVGSGFIINSFVFFE